MTNILAFSGGPDSMYLLHTLLAKKPILAHLNHNLRGNESDQDEIFCKKIAKKYGLIIETEKITLAKKNEETARIARYDFLEKIRQKYHAEKILTAHHLNDSIETILLNLTRGTGINGLTGIKNYKYISRPLSTITRSEILAYLKKHKIPYREDSSNSDQKFSRNFIRLEIIPRLKKLNPNLEKTFLTNIENFQETQDFINISAEKLVTKNSFSTSEFKKMHPCVQSAILLKINHEFSRKNLIELKNLILKNKTGTKKLGMEIRYGKVVLTNTENSKPQGITFSILKISPKSLKSKNAIFLNFDKIGKLENIKTRTHKPGDSIKPLGLKGKSQKLQDIFVNKKIPKHLRNKIPILTLNNGEIISAGNLTISEKYKITATTKKILKVNFDQQ